jgi:hypothetical protein
VNISGGGTGTLTYAINEEQAVSDAHCAVTGAEDDDAGTLVLTVSFDDPSHGWIVVGITVSDFSASVTTYDGTGGALAVLVDIANVAGTWINEPTSSASLNVHVVEGRSSATYTGTFDAANLAWQGSGTEDALAIKFGTFDLTMNAQEDA